MITPTVLAGKYLANLVRRAATTGNVSPAEITHFPKLIDKVYGNDNGVFEVSDIVDAATTIGSGVVHKIGDAVDFLVDLFF